MAAASDLLPYYNLAKQGRIFHGNIAAAGVVLPIYSNTTQQVGLWNPVGSGVDLILYKIALTYVSTTAAAGGYVLAQITNAPAAVGTGLALTAFTATAGIPAYNGNNTQAQLGIFGQGATITLTTAATVKRHLSLSQNAFTAAGTGQMAFENSINFAGDEVITPGTAVFVAGNIATLATWSGSLSWIEVPR